MTIPARDELWNKLTESGLVSGELPVEGGPQSPWPVRVMLGFAGWLGALFLLGFAGSAFALLFRNEKAALPAGVVCCVAAYAIFRGMPRNDFVGQFGLAISLAGQALILVGLVILSGEHMSTGTYLIMAAVESVLAVVLPNFVHRVFTTFAANFCFSIAMVGLSAPGIAAVVAAAGTAVVWLDQVRLATRPSLWEPLGYGFAIALLHLDGSLLMGQELWNILLSMGTRSVPLSIWLLYAGPVVAGLVFVYVVWQLRARAGVEPQSRAGIFTMAAAVVIALCGLGAPGISAAVLVLILGFANSDRVLMGLGLLAFGGYLSHFYYQLSSTLLIKSIVLAATGVALLALRFAIERFLPAEGGARA